MAERTDELTTNGDPDEVSADDADVDLDSDALGVDGTGAGTGVGQVGEFESDVDVGAEPVTATEAGQDSDASRVGRVKGRAGDVFSPTTFLLQLGAALVGAFVVGNLIPLIPFAGFLGIFLMVAVMGTLSSKPRYVEAAVAGGASGALALFLSTMGLSFVTGGMVPVAGAVAGALAALVGFYAGRDLRDGVTRDL